MYVTLFPQNLIPPEGKQVLLCQGQFHCCYISLILLKRQSIKPQLLTPLLDTVMQDVDIVLLSLILLLHFLQKTVVFWKDDV